MIFMVRCAHDELEQNHDMAHIMVRSRAECPLLQEGVREKEKCEYRKG
jgi:hypothetical protein